MDNDNKNTICTNSENLENNQQDNIFLPISDWHDVILVQLSEMFGDVISSDIIRSICITYDWQVEFCVEKLIQLKLKIDSEEQQVSELISFDNEQSNEMLLQNEGKPRRFLGAIPKSTNIINSQQQLTETNSNDKSTYIQQPKTLNFSDILSQRPKDPHPIDMQKTSTYNKIEGRENQRTFRQKSNKQQVENIIEKINNGYKIMVIMRGAPGSGKTYLAHEIIDKTIKGDYRNHIFSTDNYFYNINNQYVFQQDRLQDAHEFNQKCVRKRAAAGWSPIIVDNTNIKIWEMAPYVNTAVRYGYLIDILLPDNDWCKSAGKLSMKNIHAVPKDKIVKMLMNFEPVTVEELLKINNEVYGIKLPQLRHYPPLPYDSLIAEGMLFNKINLNDKSDNVIEEGGASNMVSNDKDLISWTSYNSPPRVEETKDTTITTGPKPQRESARGRNNNLDNQIIDVSLTENYIFNQSEDDWKAYEEESNEFWKAHDPQTGSSNDDGPKPQRKANKPIEVENKFVKILKNELKELPPVAQENQLTINKMERHKVGCDNESKSFVLLRQIYPNKQIDSLWDLFEKCDGNINWAIEILLKDDSSNDTIQESEEISSVFECNCDKDLTDILTNELEEDNDKLLVEFENVKSIKAKSKKDKLQLSDEMLEAKRAIEKQFILGDEHYSNHVKKIRDYRHGVLSDNIPISNDTEMYISPTSDDVFTQVEIPDEQIANVPVVEESKTNDDEGSSDAESDEMMEINLGKEFIEQLENNFGDGSMKYNLNDYKTNIFMPKSLGKQLYALWMESLYNQMEEQKMKTIKEDEEFARLLIAQQKFQNFIMPPNNLKEIFDMELAWTIYNSEMQNYSNSTPTDLASHLTRLKLCEIFPDIEKETLVEILNAHGNKFADTVEVLKDSMNSNIEDKITKTTIELFEKAKNETEKEDSMKKLLNTDTTTKNDTTDYNRSSVERKLTPEDEKRAALREFEESRNMATHHSQLKAECYKKAKEAIQKGNTSVAVYYSQIASLHKNKIDIYNQKAANCIVEVHNLTQNNPDFIDLHYLHVMEAEQCLDIFLDKHVTKMRNLSRSYKYIFIITGRGLHSTRGVSAIKNRVKFRLRERNLKWTEVNPGLLKVKIFPASKYSKNI